MRIDRRTFMMGLSAAAVMQAVPANAFVAGATKSAADAAAEKLFAASAEALLRAYPENASDMGIDTGARRGLKALLTDRTPAGVAKLAADAGARLAAFRKVDEAQLSPNLRRDLEVSIRTHELAVEGFAFGYGDTANLNRSYGYRNSPYTMSHNTGAFVEIPDFLANKHPFENVEDGDMYLSRMEAYATALDGETERLKAEYDKGVILPDFLLDKAIAQVTAGRSKPVADWEIVSAIRAAAPTVPAAYAERARAIAAGSISAALDRQLAELKRHRAIAKPDAGAWKLPDGDAYYGWALRTATTTNLTPNEVHERGKEELKLLQDRMDGLLRKQGLTEGTVGARMTALGKDPQYLYPNTDAGRQQILDYVNDRINDIRARMPQAFATLVPGNLVVKRVPPAIENGAPDGYASAGSVDGTRPGAYYINLRDTSIWPRHSLPTLSYHEGIPGHVWQGEYVFDVPLLRSLYAFNAYTEGWALYAEQLADELGVYEGDPVGQLGYLQSISFRACRLVVDTGLHAKRWTREQAVEWFARTNGSPEEQVRGEVDRYCAWPGQACGYKLGHSEINRIRREMQAAAGAGFDLKRFNDAVVTGGEVPLDLLETFVAEALGRKMPA
ncbi:MAG: DUF885 domain-containing protein [Alphaproteobacteria bacterium]|nr:MAG: DUF885 domain-containing protein [Alphaproteobacteria bacterium]